MDFNIEIRKKQLDHLDQLISSSRDRIDSVLKYLGWTAENVEKEDSLVACPINFYHRLGLNSWNTHLEKCLIKLERYNLRDQFLSESLQSETQSIYIDHNKKVELITKELTERGPFRLAWNGLDPDPRTSDRLMSSYSPDERLIFYNYCIANTVGPPPPPEFTTLHNKTNNEEKPPSYEELLVQERDAKRRRTKYRSVHINRKNHTEVIREVINGQMEEYKEWLLSQEQKKTKDECSSNNGINDDKKEEDRPHSSTSRNSNHSSSSRSTTRRYDRYRDRRERSRERYYRSKDCDRRNRSNERYKKSPRRESCEEVKHKSNNSVEKRHSSTDKREKRDDHGRRR